MRSPLSSHPECANISIHRLLHPALSLGLKGLKPSIPITSFLKVTDICPLSLYNTESSLFSISILSNAKLSFLSVVVRGWLPPTAPNPGIWMPGWNGLSSSLAVLPSKSNGDSGAFVSFFSFCRLKRVEAFFQFPKPRGFSLFPKLAMPCTAVCRLSSFLGFSLCCSPIPRMLNSGSSLAGATVNGLTGLLSK